MVVVGVLVVVVVVFVVVVVVVVAVTVFNFIHPPVLSALLLILPASRFLAPDSPLLVPAPFLFLVHLHGMTVPFLFDRNPLWRLIQVKPQNIYFPQNYI